MLPSHYSIMLLRVHSEYCAQTAKSQAVSWQIGGLNKGSLSIVGCSKKCISLIKLYAVIAHVSLIFSTTDECIFFSGALTLKWILSDLKHDDENSQRLRKEKHHVALFLVTRVLLSHPRYLCYLDLSFWFPRFRCGIILLHLGISVGQGREKHWRIVYLLEMLLGIFGNRTNFVEGYCFYGAWASMSPSLNSMTAVFWLRAHCLVCRCGFVMCLLCLSAQWQLRVDNRSFKSRGRKCVRVKIKRTLCFLRRGRWSSSNCLSVNLFDNKWRF